LSNRRQSEELEYSVLFLEFLHVYLFLATIKSG